MRYRCTGCGDEIESKFKATHEPICAIMAAVESIQVDLLLFDLELAE